MDADETTAVTAQHAAPSHWRSRLPHTDADVLAIVSLDGRCLDVSATAATILGIQPADVIGTSPIDFFDTKDQATIRAIVAQVKRSGRARTTIRLLASTGQPVWFDVAAKTIDSNTAGGAPYVVVSARDATDDVLALQHLAESEQRWRLAFEHSPIGAALVSPDGDILLANGSLGRMLGRRTESLSMLSLRDVTHPDDAEIDSDRLAELLGGDVQTYSVERRLVTADGETLWVHQTAAAAPDLQGNVNGVIVQLQDITQRREAELQLASRALHDPLTGLPNRFLVQQWLNSALQEHLGSDVGVLSCDIDRFKVVNDSLGHLAGDDLLVEVAARLRDAVRPDDLVGRVGGDDFVIVCERVADVNDLLQVAARLSAMLDEPIDIGGRSHTVTISVGAAIGRLPESGDELLMRADMALMRAKRLGRARVELFDHSVDRIATPEDLDMEQQLRGSVAAGELRAFYQPIVTLPSRQVVGHEALLRWEHPDRGLLSPDRFLQIAESTGLIRSLGWWILDRACRDTAVGAGGVIGVGAGGTWVAVNASPSQLTRPGVFDTVHDTLTHAGLEPRQLHLEITETALMQASGTLLEELRRLQECGVEIVLDDFGTGFSSLSLLRDLPVDTVKIDRSFVMPMLEDPSALAIVRAVVGMAGDLGITTVAEGIENEAQAEALAELGCAQAQGFLFGRPEAVPRAADGAFAAAVSRLYPQPGPIDEYDEEVVSR